MPLSYDEKGEEDILLKIPNKIPKLKKKNPGIDLRDEIDPFILWIKSQNKEIFTGKRRAVIGRIIEYKRPALIEGTMELLTRFLKEKGYKVMK